MGNLAQRGVAFGKKVPLNGLLSRQPNDSFHVSLRFLEQLGFGTIAGKVLDGLELEVSEIECLLSQASFPALLKLVELKGNKLPAEVRPAPLAVLPVFKTMRNHGVTRAKTLLCESVRSNPHANVEYVVDSFEFNLLESGVLDVLKSITLCRDDLRIVGPAPAEIFDWVCTSTDTSSPSEVLRRAQNIIDALKAAGVHRLQACNSHRAIHLLHDSGLPNCLVTDISLFANPGALARELSWINQLSGASRAIDVWVPATGCPGARSTCSDAVQDLRILRTLAVGALCLDNVPFKRASSRRLSLDGLMFSRHCGANDLGYGAVDTHTSESLKLQPLNLLITAMG